LIYYSKKGSQSQSATMAVISKKIHWKNLHIYFSVEKKYLTCEKMRVK
jgi:hypothetical protein